MLSLQLIKEQEHLLKAKGLDQDSLQSPERKGYFMHRLHAELLRCINQSILDNEVQHFILDSSGFFDDHTVLINFRFNFQFDPSKQDLTLINLVAQMDDVKKIYITSDPKMMYSAKQIYDDLQSVKLSKTISSMSSETQAGFKKGNRR